MFGPFACSDTGTFTRVAKVKRTAEISTLNLSVFFTLFLPSLGHFQLIISELSSPPLPELLLRLQRTIRDSLELRSLKSPPRELGQPRRESAYMSRESNMVSVTFFYEAAQSPLAQLAWTRHLRRRLLVLSHLRLRALRKAGASSLKRSWRSQARPEADQQNHPVTVTG